MVIFIAAIPYLEKKLYALQEEKVIAFMNSAQHLIENESQSIDQYWKMIVDEQKKKMADILNIYSSVLKDKNYNVAKTEDFFRENTRLHKLSDKAAFWIMSGNGQIMRVGAIGIKHGKAKLFRDYYGYAIYNDILQKITEAPEGTKRYSENRGNRITDRKVYFKSLQKNNLIIGVEVAVDSLDQELEKQTDSLFSKINTDLKRQRFSKKSNVVVIRGSGEIVASSDKGLRGSDIAEIIGANNKDRINNATKEPSANRIVKLEEKSAEKTTIIWTRHFPDYDCNLLFYINEDTLYGAADQLKIQIAIASVLFILGINFIALLFTGRVSSVVKKLSDLTAGVKKGDLSVRVKVERMDELGELADSINEMILTIEERNASLTNLNACLHKATEDANAANKSKTGFLATISHDLLQPIGAARLFASSIIDNPQESAKRPAEKIKETLKTAEQLIAELVEISKLNAGTIKPDISSFPLNDLFNEISRAYSAKATAKGLQLIIVKTTVIVKSDKKFLRHIINNLVSNAIRYTERGKVLLGCRRQINKEEGNISIEVIDTGRGISNTQKDEVFREFVRLEKADNNGDKCFGLGLAIVKGLTSLLKYEVKLDSKSGKGSRFSIIVPQAISHENESIKDNADIITITAKKVLYIDDDTMQLAYMEKILTEWGLETIPVASKEEAFEYLDEYPGELDIIISDYHIAENLNGVEIINQIRKSGNKEISAFIVTSDRTEEVAENIHNNKIRFINKPINKNELLEEIMRAI